MTTHQADLQGSIASRASQLRAAIRQDIFLEKNSPPDWPKEKTFLILYFKKWGIFKEYSLVNTTRNVLVDDLSWNDWYDRW